MFTTGIKGVQNHGHPLDQGSRECADAFTKNLDGSAFEKCIKALVGQDIYMKNLATSEQGGCQEMSDGTQKSTGNFN